MCVEVGFINNYSIFVASSVKSQVFYYMWPLNTRICDLNDFSRFGMLMNGEVYWGLTPFTRIYGVSSQ